MSGRSQEREHMFEEVTTTVARSYGCMHGGAAVPEPVEFYCQYYCVALQSVVRYVELV